MRTFINRVSALDRRIAAFMDRWSMAALRGALALVYIWFGLLKPLGVSPADPMVLMTSTWLPLLGPRTWVNVIGWWEVLIGVLFLFRPTIRAAILLLMLQMVGTAMPLVLLPELTFQEGRWPWGPTMEGQYIFKNVLIIAAALAVGGSVRRGARGTESASGRRYAGK